MALVNEIDVISKPKAQPNHALRPCTACYEPGVYLQLDTYASDEGKEAGDVKQAIRFDRAGAARLLELIALTFPDLPKD
jgi:hypothetical protein